MLYRRKCSENRHLGKKFGYTFNQVTFVCFHLLVYFLNFRELNWGQEERRGVGGRGRIVIGLHLATLEFVVSGPRPDRSRRTGHTSVVTGSVGNVDPTDPCLESEVVNNRHTTTCSIN